MNAPDLKTTVFRARAAEAQLKAEQTTAADAKAIWQEIAYHWRMMAEQAERQGW
jgi:hypothetical protein